MQPADGHQGINPGVLLGRDRLGDLDTDAVDQLLNLGGGDLFAGSALIKHLQKILEESADINPQTEGLFVAGHINDQFAHILALNRIQRLGRQHRNRDLQPGQAVRHFRRLEAQLLVK